MVIDIVAIIFGILFSIRKLETRRREPEQFPAVPAEIVERYKARALRVYNLGAGACFGKLILDYGFQFVAGRLELPWSLVRVVGASIFFAWLGLDDLGLDCRHPCSTVRRGKRHQPAYAHTRTLRARRAVGPSRTFSHRPFRMAGRSDSMGT